jgi:hypothetical protein
VYRVPVEYTLEPASSLEMGWFILSLSTGKYGMWLLYVRDSRKSATYVYTLFFCLGTSWMLP